MAGSVGLFGLRKATLGDRSHPAKGLNFVLDITQIVDTLHLENALDADALTVRIVPHRPIPDQAQSPSDESAFTARACNTISDDVRRPGRGAGS